MMRAVIASFLCLFLSATTFGYEKRKPTQIESWLSEPDQLSHWLQDYLNKCQTTSKKCEALQPYAVAVMDLMATHPHVRHIAIYSRLVRTRQVAKSIRRDAIIGLVNLARLEPSAAETLGGLLLSQSVAKSDRQLILEHIGAFNEGFAFVKHLSEGEIEDLALFARVVTTLSQMSEPGVLRALSQMSNRLEFATQMKERKGWTRKKVFAHLNRALYGAAKRTLARHCAEVI